MSSFWTSIKKALDEGQDEGEHGAPTDRLIDAMMLAARADSTVSQDELRRVAALLTKHFRSFAALPKDRLHESLSRCGARLDAMGDAPAQLEQVARSLRDHGSFAVERAYALAYAVLLADEGVTGVERAFADALGQALALDPRRRVAIEDELQGAA